LKKNNTSKSFTLLFFVFVCLFKLTSINYKSSSNYGVIDWDNFGYYLYLPAIFIYDDLKLQNEDRIIEIQKKYDFSSTFYQAHKIHNGNRVIQYTSGTAFIYFPAFVAGHIWANLSANHPADGFSAPYQIAVLIESLLLLYLGLFFLRKFSLVFFDDTTSTIIIGIICLGTNYLQIVLDNPATPHTLLFAAYAFLLYYIQLWHTSPKFKYLISISIVSAIMILSRPNELLFLIIPLFWLGGVFPNFKTKINFFIKNPIQLITAIIPFAFFGGIQLFYWNHLTGEWIYDSYRNEDFKLLDPYLFEYLFSFKKGWLLYTPLMIFSLIGLIYFYFKNKKLSIPFIVFTILTIWVLASWDCWWYADSYSQRSIIQSYPIFVLPLGYFILSIRESKIFIRYSVIGLMSFLFILTLFQTYQFKKGVIHSKRMTKEYYIASFFDLTPDPLKQKLLDPNRDVNYLPKDETFKQHLLYESNYESLSNSTFTFNNKELPHEGSLILSASNLYSEAFSFPFNKYCDSSYAYYVAKIRYRSNYPANENPFYIIAKTSDSRSGSVYKYVFKSIEEINWFEEGSWSSMELVFIPPYLRSKSDSLSFFIALDGNNEVEIDQFYVTQFDPSKKPKINTTQFFTDYHSIVNGKWNQPSLLATDKGYEQIDSNYQYSSTLSLPSDELCLGKKATISFSGISLDKTTETMAVLSINNENNENIWYKSFPVDKSISWEKQSFETEIPYSINNNHVFKCYLWNKSSTPFLIKWISFEMDC
tara:strand:+ start:576 stop:2852 length:2277 start_codon:yes stop_codon:yes gene_type:complete